MAIHPVLWYTNKKWEWEIAGVNSQRPTDLQREEIDYRLKDFMAWNEYPNNITDYSTRLDR